MRGQPGRNVTATMAISPNNLLVFCSAVIGGMNAQRFDDFFAQTRLKPGLHDNFFGAVPV